MENNSFFDPYSYITGNINPKTNYKTQKNENEELDQAINVITPKEFYDTQYSYYRYLNELIKYKAAKEEQDTKRE